MKKTGVWQVLRSACVGGWLTAGLFVAVDTGVWAQESLGMAAYDGTSLDATANETPIGGEDPGIVESEQLLNDDDLKTYTPVEFIESTLGGGQYIDTEYTANDSTRVLMDAYIPPMAGQFDSWCVLFGSRTLNDWANKSFSIQLTDTSCIRFAYNGEFVLTSAISFGERMTISCGANGLVWTGRNAGNMEVGVESLARSKSTLYIFGDNSVAQDGRTIRSTITTPGS